MSVTRDATVHDIREQLLRLTVSEAEADVVLSPIMILVDEYAEEMQRTAWERGRSYGQAVH